MNSGDKAAALKSTPYEGLWHAYGTFNERMLVWINAVLAASHTNVSGAMQAFAADRGAYNWDSLGDLGLV